MLPHVHGGTGDRWRMLIFLYSYSLTSCTKCWREGFPNLRSWVFFEGTRLQQSEGKEEMSQCENPIPMLGFQAGISVPTMECTLNTITEVHINHISRSLPETARSTLPWAAAKRGPLVSWQVARTGQRVGRTGEGGVFPQHKQLAPGC